MAEGRTVLTLAAVLSGAATVAGMLTPHFLLVAQPELRAALETAASLMALLAGFLAFGRVRRRSRLTDLTLACALGVIALSSLSFAAVPTVAGLADSGFAERAAIIGRLLGSILFGAAAFVPVRQVRRSGRAQATAAAGMAAGLALVILAGSLLAVRLPAVAAAAHRQPLPVREALHGNAVLLALEMLTAVLDGAAAASYLGWSRRLGDEFFGWLAVAAVFAAAAEVNFLLYPSLYAQAISAGDAFQLCFYLVLLAGSLREIWSYWLAQPEAMVLNERRRIARDLHDGLAQELAYLTRHLDALDGNVEQETLSRLRSATERAWLESRLAISGLAFSGRTAVAEAVATAVSDTARRFGVELELNLVRGIQLPPAHTEALVRIACEAVSNAAQHSGAGRVRLTVHSHGPGVRLRVSDSGRGFDPASADGGFGLTSMRDRASQAGGELRISSTPGCGTEVEAIL